MKKTVFISSLLFAFLSVNSWAVVYKNTLTLSPTDKDIQEKISGIKDNTKVVLKKGTYKLKDSVSFYNKKNIRIEGQGEVKLEGQEDWMDILVIGECDGIEVSGIHMTHRKPHVEENWECSGHVINMYASKNILVEKCDLNGSGIVGINAFDIKGLTVVKNNIHKNSAWALHFQDTEPLIITDNDITDNGGSIYYQGGQITDNMPDNAEARKIFEGKLVLVVENNRFQGNNYHNWGWEEEKENMRELITWLRSKGVEIPESVTKQYEEDTYDNQDNDGYQEGDENNYDNSEGYEYYDEEGDNQVAQVLNVTPEMINSGEFDLSDWVNNAPDGSSVYFQAGKYYTEINMYGKKGFLLAGDGKVEIVSTNMDSDILSMTECYDITIKDLIIYHEPPVPEDYTCSGSVISMGACGNITINYCQLNGCGTHGISAYSVYNLQITHTEFFNNSVDTLVIYDGYDLLLSYNDFHNNAGGLSINGVFIYKDTSEFESLGLSMSQNKYKNNKVSEWEGYDRDYAIDYWKESYQGYILNKEQENQIDSGYDDNSEGDGEEYNGDY